MVRLEWRDRGRGRPADNRQARQRHLRDGWPDAARLRSVLRGFSNATLWPAFHYRNDLSRFDREEYAGYMRVNAGMAKQLKALIGPDDIIWVHDYHLLPFAQECRAAGIKNPIGFFLHIPFPVPEIMRTVPPHEELDQGDMQL